MNRENIIDRENDEWEGVGKSRRKEDAAKNNFVKKLYYGWPLIATFKLVQYSDWGIDGGLYREAKIKTEVYGRDQGRKCKGVKRSALERKKLLAHQSRGRGVFCT